MDIAEFQEWTRDRDAETQWNVVTTPQLLAHLMGEIGEVAFCNTDKEISTATKKLLMLIGNFFEDKEIQC